MGEVEEAIACYDSALAIDPNSASTLYNKRFALYNIKKLDEAAVCKAKLDEVDPGFVEALQERGTRYFLPATYNSNLDYSLPSRWYGGEENFSENISMNRTDISQQPGTIQEPYDNWENNTFESIPEPDEDQGIQGNGYWYVPESDEGSDNYSENYSENYSDNYSENYSDNYSENYSEEWNIQEAS